MEKRLTVREKYNSYKDIKIAVYNIMKNEGKFLDGWLQNMKGADRILLLDTGSENGEYEKALSYSDEHPEFKGKLVVEQEIITPWAFHTARNRNMEMIPDEDEVDVIISIDLDERVEKGFFDELRKTAWEHPKSCGFYYYYAWSHDPETKRPLRVFGYNKASFWMKGEIWYDYDVHEALQYSKGFCEFYNDFAAWMDKNTIWLHHWPDHTKSRGSYLGLLEQRVKNYPEDEYGKFYLFREQGFYGMWDQAVRNAFWLYCRLTSKNDDMFMLPAVCTEIANYCTKISEKEKEVEFFYQRAIELDPTFRDPYFLYAKWLGYQGRPVEALKILNEGILKSRRHYDWRELSTVWEPWYEAQIRGIAYAWLGDYELSHNVMLAASLSLKSDNDKKEAKENGFYVDFEFVKNKIKSR